MITLHCAPMVVPVGRPPLADGAVAVEGETIQAVGPRGEVEAAYTDAEVVEWEGVLTPGLVNAHIHLQYTSFAVVGSERHASYVGWSERFVREYEARAGENWRATALGGVESALRAGITCFADIVTDVEAMSVLADSGVAGVSYFEIIGVTIERWKDEVEAMAAAILAVDDPSGATRVGLSPHAPYTVDEPVMKEAAALARRSGKRLHTHLAESDTEDSYYRTGTGALADRVTMRVGRPWSVVARGGSGTGSAEYARTCGMLGPDSHVAHGVYLGEDGRRILKEEGTFVALCPRSNVTVGVDPPPIADYLREGGLIAVGTDSLGSNRSLDILEDVALLRDLAVEEGYREGDLDRRLLEAVTLGGARALGMDSILGTLEPKKRADLACFDLESSVDEVERDLVESGAGRCTGVVTAGTLRFRAD